MRLYANVYNTNKLYIFIKIFAKLRNLWTKYWKIYCWQIRYQSKHFLTKITTRRILPKWRWPMYQCVWGLRTGKSQIPWNKSVNNSNQVKNNYLHEFQWFLMKAGDLGSNGLWLKTQNFQAISIFSLGLECFIFYCNFELKWSYYDQKTNSCLLINFNCLIHIRIF